jgi:hypothetical protein
MADSAEPFTEQEVEAFAHKLRFWGESLPDREQQLLSGLVESAAHGDDNDTSGYFFGGALALAIQTTYTAPPPTAMTKQEFVGKVAQKQGLSQ